MILRLFFNVISYPYVPSFHTDEQELSTHDFGVIFAQRSFGSIVKSSSKISTNTGLAPVAITAFAVATKVNDGMRTSLPGPLPDA